MQLATWNCPTGLTSNWGVIEELGAHVLTVQECGPKTEQQVAERDGWTCKWQVGRYDVGRRRGLAVLARSPYKIEVLERSEPCLISTLVSGPNGLRFRFVGFWGMSPLEDGTDSYARQAADLIEQLPDDGLPTVVAGDFNASWGNPDHLRNAANLAARGMVSAYNSFYNVEPGVPPRHPTSYHQRNVSRPFHMDYVFVPEVWPIQSVEVGSFEDYPGRGLSDHVPVIVSISPEQPAV